MTIPADRVNRTNYVLEGIHIYRVEYLSIMSGMIILNIFFACIMSWFCAINIYCRKRLKSIKKRVIRSYF